MAIQQHLCVGLHKNIFVDTYIKARTKTKTEILVLQIRYYPPSNGG